MFKSTTLTVFLMVLFPGVDLNFQKIYAETSEQAVILQTGEGLEVPFSFVYDGRCSSYFLSGWERKERSLPRLDRHRDRREVTYQDPETGLLIRAEVIIYQDFPAIEWLLSFKNTSSSDTPIIENIQALDKTLNCNTNEKCVTIVKE